jgi:GDP-D-mannose 3',5'-epimerase
MHEASHKNGVQRFFYSSSASDYPEYTQLTADNEGPKEDTVWPAHPRNAYVLEKIFTEELAMHYEKDFGMVNRMTICTCKCNHQTRSFTFIDDCIDGAYRLFVSDYEKPVNIGSDEMISIHDLVQLALSFCGRDVPLTHIPGLEGLRG